MIIQIYQGEMIMNLIKRIVLLLSIFCVAMPARAMAPLMDACMSGDKVAIAVAIGGTSLFGVLGLTIARKVGHLVSVIRENRWIDRENRWTDPDLEITKASFGKEGYLKEKDCNGCTPLHWVAHQGQEEKVKLLLAHGADVAVKDNGGWTPLYTAAFHGHTETVRCILQHAPFSPTKKSNEPASQARIKEALLVCMRNNLPRDVRNKIISYLPEDILNQTHCRLAFTYGADLNKLVAQCPFEWFLCIYDAILPGHKSEFWHVMVPAITEYRMSKVRELLADPKLQELDPATTNPLILAMLDVTNVEQHRTAIEQNVRDAFTSRVFQKRPKLKLVNVHKGVQDVMNSDLQQNLARD